MSWAAIFAGAAALALILLILGMGMGMGLGMTAASPWASQGVSTGTFGGVVIVWLTVTQILAAGLGGYLAGRLRTTWVSAHTDEIYFRDAAHGFLGWAVAALVTAGALASATGIVNSGVQAVGAIAGTAVTSAVSTGAAAASDSGGTAMSGGGASSYFIDSLFRKDNSAPSATAPTAASGNADATAANSSASSAASSAAEVSRIFVNSLRTGTLPADDVRFVKQIVAQRTALTQADAEKRINETFTRMQTKWKEAETAALETADIDRKASAYAALRIFVSLPIGAFAAGLAATFGGRQRDFQHSATL